MFMWDNGNEWYAICMPLNTLNIDLQNMISPKAMNCFATKLPEQRSDKN